MAYFSCLKLDVLQDHASRWAHTFPRLTRISLHQYHGQQEPPATYRYAIIFELDLETETHEKQEDGSLKVSSEAFDIFAYDYFYGDLFKMVYNYENIDPYYKNEWFFFPKYSNEKWPDFAPEEPCWQLFPIERLADVETIVETQSEPAQERGTPMPEKAANFFTRGDDKHWRVGFNGKECIINPLAGVHYIAILLERPGTSISCRDLYREVSGQTPNNIMSEGAAIDEGLNIGSTKQAVSSPKAKAEYIKKYIELERDLLKINDLPDNDRTPEHEMVKKEIENDMAKIMPYLKERTLVDPNDKKAQVNITKRLDKAYEAISKASMEELAKHLQNHIKPDGAFGLMYTGFLTWDITIK